MHGKIRNFFESLVILAIILVLIQTFFEDLALVLGWSWNVRRSFAVAGFAFDLFFTIEFLIRFFSALSCGQGKEYFLHGKGWIDFFASIPLLLFNSGPMMLALTIGGGAVAGLGGVFNILKIAKAVRIARILRLLRVLKIFKQIKNTDSIMAQRHLSLITTLVITVTVATIFGVGLFQQVFSSTTGTTEVFDKMEEVLLNEVSETGIGSMEKAAERLPTLLIVKKSGETIYTRYGNEYYREYFGPMDYRYQQEGEYGFFLSVKPVMEDQAGRSLIFFILIVLMVLSLLFYYSPHFA